MKNDLVYHVLVTREPDEAVYSALCLELDLAADGSTQEAAIQNLKEAVSLYVESVLEDHDFKALFRPAPKEEWEKYFSKNPTPHIVLESLSA